MRLAQQRAGAYEVKVISLYEFALFVVEIQAVALIVDCADALEQSRVTYTITPRAYVSGLVQYNSRSEAVSANFRLRWEWAPGSELFVVYSEERKTDVTDRWSELGNRGIVIKVNRLLRI